MLQSCAEQDPEAKIKRWARPRCRNRVLSRTQKPKWSSEKDPDAEIEWFWDSKESLLRSERNPLLRSSSPPASGSDYDRTEDLSVILCFSVRSEEREEKKRPPFGHFSKRHRVSSMQKSLHSRSPCPRCPTTFSCHSFLHHHRHNQCVKTLLPLVAKWWKWRRSGFQEREILTYDT